MYLFTLRVNVSAPLQFPVGWESTSRVSHVVFKHVFVESHDVPSATLVFL